MQHKITIEDISRHTGLSRGTVSRALNDRPDISEQTKRRVLEACNQLKYVPSHAARSLATGRRYAVALLVDDLRSMFSGSFLRGAIKRARANHYAVHVSEIGSDPESALDHLRSLVSERVDAVLLATWLRPDLARQLSEVMAERPLVTTSPIEGVLADFVAPDYMEAGRIAARHLLRGHETNILYVQGAQSPPADQRRAGFHEVCREAGIDPESVTVTVGAHSLDAPSRLDEVRNRLSSIRGMAGSDDFVALELMFLALQADRHPGRDISILGQGNEAFGAQIAPSLTSIDYAGEQIGQRALDIALERVTKTRQDPAIQAAIPPVLIARESTHQLQ
jgi:DNA-binding LacI/PurR family transcriptional regulator